MLNRLEFANPEFLFLLVLIPAWIAWMILRKKQEEPTMTYSVIDAFTLPKKKAKGYFRYALHGLRMLAFTALIIALARPQSSNDWQDIQTEGIDIVIAMDVSTSMLAEDFKPNRLEAAKDVAAEFIASRPNDRMGLVVFSGQSFTQCPLTTDQASLLNLFRSVKTGLIEDGTAIGEGLATALNRLKDSEAKSKVIILLTDGENNMGVIDPYTAADIAKTFNIRTYTIGVGTIGKAPYPFQTPFGMQYQNVDVKIDEPLLKHIAETTDGKYFRATDKGKLKEIYQEIDKLEKSKISVREFHRKHEKFMIFLIAGIALLVIEVLLRQTIYRFIP